jgi:hypothetical protein
LREFLLARVALASRSRPNELVGSGSLYDPEPDWSVDQQTDPVVLSSAYAHHRVLRAVIQAAGLSTMPLGGAALDDLARRLTTTGSDRTVRDKLLGRQRLSLDDVLTWAMLLGGEVLSGLPSDGSDLLPDACRPHLPEGWSPGQGVPILTAAAPEVAWAAALEHLAAQLRADERASLERHGTLTTLVHDLLRALATTGMTGARLQHLAAHQGLAEFVGPHVTVRVVYAPERLAAGALDTHRVVVGTAAEIASAPADLRFLLLALGATPFEHLRAVLPQTLPGSAGPHRLTLETVHAAQGESPVDVDITPVMNVLVSGREIERLVLLAIAKIAED